jgi:hypothetical protein
MKRLAILLVTVVAAGLLSAPSASAALRPSPARATSDVRSDYMASCYQTKTSGSRPTYCAFGKRSSRVRVAVIGDSVTKQYVTALDHAGRTRGWRVDVYGKTACSFGKYNGRAGKQCAAWNRNVMRKVRRAHYDYVVTALYETHAYATSRYRSDSQRRARFISGMRQRIAYLQRGGARVVLLNDTPKFGHHVPRCLRGNQSRPSRCNESRSYALSSQRFWTSSARAKLMRGLVPSRRLVSITGSLCSSRSCMATKRGIIIYRDSHHFTETFVRWQREVIARGLTRALR